MVSSKIDRPHLAQLPLSYHPRGSVRPANFNRRQSVDDALLTTPQTLRITAAESYYLAGQQANSISLPLWLGVSY
jgi:hypothetical protein